MHWNIIILAISLRHPSDVHPTSVHYPSVVHPSSICRPTVVYHLRIVHPSSTHYQSIIYQPVVRPSSVRYPSVICPTSVYHFIIRLHGFTSISFFLSNSKQCQTLTKCILRAYVTFNPIRES